MFSKNSKEIPGKTKKAVEISNYLSDYISTASEIDNNKELEEMYETLFSTFFNIFKVYDSKTLNNLHKNFCE